MAGNYTYFIASLPILLFGTKPPFSSERFLEMCAEHISGGEVALLKAAPDAVGTIEEVRQATLKRWIIFDTALRNELTRIRSARRKQDHKYLRGDGYTDPSIAAAALKAHRSSSVLEGERMLDEARWSALDDFEVGNHFNIDFLVIYAIKLSILGRWERIRVADGERLVEEVLHGESQ